MKEEDDIEEDNKKNKEGGSALTPGGVVPTAYRDRFGDDYDAYRRWADQ